MTRLLIAKSQSELDRHYDRALLYAVAAVRRDAPVDAQRALLAALQQRLGIVRILRGHDGPVLSMAFSTESNLLVTGGQDGAIIKWDLTRIPAGKETVEQKEGAVRSVIVGGEGTLAFARDAEGVVLRNLESGSREQVRCLSEDTGDSILALALSPGQERVVAGGVRGNVVEWDRKARTCRTLGSHKAKVRGVAFDSRGRLASAGDDGAVFLWEGLLSQPERIETKHRQSIGAFALSQTGSLVAGVERIVYETAPSAKQLSPLSGTHELPIESLAVSPDGTYIVSASEDKAVLWQPPPERSSELLMTDVVDSVAFHPYARGQFATGSADGVVTLWDVQRRRSLGIELTTEGGPPVTVGFLGKGAAIAVDRNTVRQWRLDRRQGQQPQSAQSRPDGAGDAPHDLGRTVTSAALSPSGRLLATWDGSRVQLLELTDGSVTESATLQLKHCGDPRKAPRIKTLVFGSEGTLVGHCRDGYIVLWQGGPDEWLDPQSLPGQDAWADAVAVTGDKPLLVTATRDKLRAWRLSNGQPAERVDETDRNWTAGVLALAQDGGLVVGSRGDTGLFIWSRGVGSAEEHQLEQWVHIASMALSPDGTRVAVAGTPTKPACDSPGCRSCIGLWDVRNRVELGLIGCHEEPITSLAFSSDSRQLITGGDNGSIALWDVDPLSWAEKACAIANNRDLLAEEWSDTADDYSAPCTSSDANSAQSVRTQ